MRIFITGASGFVGRNLLKELRKSNKYKMGCLVRRIIEDADIKIFYGTLEEANLDSMLNDYDMVVHLAAIIKHKDKGYLKCINEIGTKRLVDACVKNKIKKVIFLSSYLADNLNSSYGISKYNCEKIIKNSGLIYTILRSALIYGVDDKNLGNIISTIKNNLFVPVIGFGRFRLQPIYINDVVEIIVRCMNDKKTNNKMYYIGGKPIEFVKMVDLITKQLAVKRIKIYIPSILFAIILKIYEKIVREPKFTLEQMHNLVNEKLFNIDYLEREFNIRLTKFEDGVKLILKIVRY